MYFVLLLVLYVNVHVHAYIYIYIYSCSDLFLCFVGSGRSSWKLLRTMPLLQVALRAKYLTGPRGLDWKETPTYKRSEYQTCILL